MDSLEGPSAKLSWVEEAEVNRQENEKNLSGHIHFFYTGKPPKPSGGSHPLLVFIRPYVV